MPRMNSDEAIGSIELRPIVREYGTKRNDERELGFWLGKPFWGYGYMPEAAEEIIRHGFEDLGLDLIWCSYHGGNQKSKRIQEKVGFLLHHTCENAPVPLLGEYRTRHTNILTKTRWMSLKKAHAKTDKH